MDPRVEKVSDTVSGKLLYRSPAILAQATNLQRNDPRLKEAALIIDARADSLAAFAELARADPRLAESALISTLSTLTQGTSMHFANKEMNCHMHETH